MSAAPIIDLDEGMYEIESLDGWCDFVKLPKLRCRTCFGQKVVFKTVTRTSIQCHDEDRFGGWPERFTSSKRIMLTCPGCDGKGFRWDNACESPDWAHCWAMDAHDFDDNEVPW